MAEIRVGTCAFDETLGLAELSCDGLKLADAKTRRAEAPDGFEFALRAPRLITREGFRDGPRVRRAWKDALELAGALDAAVIVFTTPPAFRPTDERIADLGRFFEWAHRGRIRLAWEPSGDAWTGELVWRLCREMAVSHAVDPLRRMCVRPRPPYFRLGGFRGHHDRYTDEQLRRVRNLCTAPVTYCVFANATMSVDARRLTEIDLADTEPTSVRTVRFETLADIMADIDGFGDGPVRATGRWTAAQIVRHVADGIGRSIDGFGVRASDEMRERAEGRKDVVLDEGIPPGIQVPEDMQGLMPDPNVAWGDAVAALRCGIERAEATPLSADHPFLGVMTDEQWRKFHCRHAELHFGFLEPG